MIAVIVGALLILAGTWIGFPTVAPILAGLVVGTLWPGRAARRAAIAGVFAWGGVLLAAAARGNAVVPLSSTLGGAMGLPPWALLVATLAYPAILAASAAWLAQRVSPIMPAAARP